MQIVYKSKAVFLVPIPFHLSLSESSPPPQLANLTGLCETPHMSLRAFL